MNILQTTDLKKYYGTEPNITKALDGVTLSIEEGEFVAIVGTSGSGKSTLLNMMGGLDTPTSGSIKVKGKELSKLKDEQLTIFRRRNIGFIFQNYNLVPVLNVYENIVLPVELDGDTVDKRFMDEVVKMLALDGKLNSMPNNLSGGQQQRVAIARALVSKPAIILADEPTGNLDSRTSSDVLGLLKVTSQKFHQTLVMITHNNEIAQLADRIIRIEDGKIAQRQGVTLMDDILFGNNNQATINRLAKRSYRANKQRNVFVTIALFLTAFMITSVFSLGCSYFETYQMQQIRAMGTTADVAITSLSEEQYEELSRSGLVSVVGVSQRLGSIDTSGMDDALLSITWIDETEWQEHRVPTISDIHGDYPQAKNEIMLPTWALRAMGIDDPQIGMNISLSYQLGTDYQYISDEFVLSGYYTDYSASRAGNRGAAYVSELFATQTGLPFDSVSTAMISFSDDSNALRSCEKLKRKISFTESQSFEIVPIAQSNSATIVLPLAAIIVFIIISGYLLIYNILYISISRDTQFYGQLKTIGTTKRQIKRIVRSQIFRTAVIGIPSGLIVGGIVSLGLVPFAMNMMYSSDTDLGEIVSFSPIIFAGAAIFTFFTAIIGSMKPAKIAASISPVAASRYTEANTRSYRDHKSHRTKLSRMARDNIFRNPKSAFLTFASLFLGLILFLVSAGLLSSLSPDNFVNQWGESDFALTYSISEEGNLLSDEMLQQIETMQGIENLRVTYSASPWPTMDVIYDENVFGKYIDSLDGVSGLDFSNAETRKNYTDNFWSGVYGIDSRYIEELNKTLDKPIDLTAFEKGELVVLSAMTDDEGNLLIQPGQAITVVGESGEQVFTVATGFLDADFQSGRGNERGTAPDLYISEQALEKLSGETKIFRIAFDTIDSSYDKGIMEQLQSITASSPGITILSRYEKQQEMAGYLLTSRIIAAGLSAVFLLIGIMNFINTMVVSVNTRKHEFATLESIGMTKKQIRNVLLWEGGYYWSISFLLLATLGTAIYIPIYSAFRKMVPYAAFHYPVFSLLVVAAIVLLVCLATPVITFMQNVKQSVVERLRQN